MKKYNKFAIENNLGNFDGFSGIGKYADDDITSIISDNQKFNLLNTINPVSTGWSPRSPANTVLAWPPNLTSLSYNDTLPKWDS